MLRLLFLYRGCVLLFSSRSPFSSFFLFCFSLKGSFLLFSFSLKRLLMLRPLFLWLRVTIQIRFCLLLFLPILFFHKKFRVYFLLFLPFLFSAKKLRVCFLLFLPFLFFFSFFLFCGSLELCLLAKGRPKLLKWGELWQCWRYAL